MTELEGIVPAHTGAVLMGEAKTYNFIPSISYGTAVEGNMLVGFEAADNKAESTKDVDLAADYTTYVLATKAKEEDVEEKVGFYRKDNGFEVYNNKAYLKVPATTAKSISLRFEGSTDIDNSEITIQNSELIYDLQGRRVLTPTKGVYIVGGKKVIF